MRRYCIVAILALACLAGCGDEEDSYRLVKVTGTVTKNGKPLADAKVSFVPASTNAHSTPAVDQTGPGGTYTVMFKGRAGVAPGKYTVIITPPLDLPAGAAPPPEMAKQSGMFQMALQAKNGPAKSRTAPAEVKKEGAKSEFDAEVEPDVATKILDFDVKSL